MFSSIYHVLLETHGAGDSYLWECARTPTASKAPQSGPSESLRQRQNQSHSVQIHGLQINTQIFNVFSK